MMKLYRAVKSSYIQKLLNDGEEISSLIGRKIDNKGQTSTSPLYDTFFAKMDDYDAVFEIYAPKGTQGSYVTQLSDYGKVEQEILVNPNELFITDVQKDVIDKNGRNKTVLKALMLSKERECYKDLGQIKDNPLENQSQGNIEYQQSIEENQNERNLPVKQNRFSKFFNQIRARFSKSKEESLNTNYSEQKQERNISKSKEKKSWELDPDEKARIQKESVQIAKKYNEQQKQQEQQNQQNIQNNERIPQNQVPVQQPIDMGGMEL